MSLCLSSSSGFLVEMGHPRGKSRNCYLLQATSFYPCCSLFLGCLCLPHSLRLLISVVVFSSCGCDKIPQERTTWRRNRLFWLTIAEGWSPWWRHAERAGAGSGIWLIIFPTQRKQRENKKWGQVIKSQIPCSVTYFLLQGFSLPKCSVCFPS